MGWGKNIEVTVNAAFDQFHDTLAFTLSKVLKKNNTTQKKFRCVSLYDGSSLVTKFSLFSFMDLETPLDLVGRSVFYLCPPPCCKQSSVTHIQDTQRHLSHAGLVPDACVHVPPLSSQGGHYKKRTFLSKHHSLLPPLIPKGHCVNCSGGCA